MSKFYYFINISTTIRFKALLLSCFAIILSTNYSLAQLKAEYYDGTNFNRLETVKYVSNIDQSWWTDPPVPGIDPHLCSIRWTGKLRPGKSGTYTFSAQVDDGIRVWIDNELLIDQWDLNDLGLFKGTINLTANQEYELKVEYFNGMLEGEVRLLWKKHKEELSWYERVFGDGIKFEVIAAENFLPPKEPIKIAKKETVKTKKKVKKSSPKKKPVPPKIKKKDAPAKPLQKPTPPKPREVKIQESPRPVVSAKAAEKYIPKNVQFEKGKTKILESSFKELNLFVAFLKRHSHLKVKVEGHTDVVGDAELNLILSKARARTITEYLVENGITKYRIQSEGFGGTRPLVAPEKGKYHPANRRVMFIIEGLEDNVSK